MALWELPLQSCLMVEFAAIRKLLRESPSPNLSRLNNGTECTDQKKLLYSFPTKLGRFRGTLKIDQKCQKYILMENTLQIY